MRKLFVAVLSVVGLIIANLSPAQSDPALASNTVTKTITVKKSDGTAYAGALVSITAYDPITEQSVPFPPVVANASGIATITVPEYQDLEMLAAQPPAGDLSHGLFAKWQNFQLGTNESIEAKLSLANMVINPKTNDGSAAGIGTWIGYISENDSVDGGASSPLLRSGETGITINNGLIVGECYYLAIYNTNLAGGFGREYGLKPTLNGSTYSATAYSQSCLAPTPSSISSGKTSYELQLASPNLDGNLKSANGQTMSLPNSVSARVVLLEGLNGVPNYDSWLGSAWVNSDGSFAFYIEKPQATTQLFTSVQIAGSNTIPNFLNSSSIWMNSQGEFSTTQNGAYSASPSFKLDIRLSAEPINLKLKFVYATDLSSEPGSVYLYRTSPEPRVWFGPGYAANGIASFILEDGGYGLDFYPTNSSHSALTYKISVNGGIPSISDTAGVNQTADSSGTFVLASKAPNLAIKIKLPDDSSTAVTSGSFEITDDDYSVWISGNRYRDTNYANVPNGTYSLRVNANKPSYVEKLYSIVVSNQGIAISSDGVNYPATNGVFSLPVNIPNIKVSVLDSSNNPVGQNGTGLSAALQKKQSSGTYTHVTRTHVWNDNIVSFLNKDAGTYRIELSPNGDPNSITTYTSDFVIDATHQSIDLGTKALSAPPAKLRVRLPGSSEDLKWAYMYIQGSSIYRDADTGNSGVAALDVSAAGTYTIQVEPPYSKTGQMTTAKTYTATVTGTPGSFSVAIAGATQNLAGDFILVLDTPNVTGKLLLPNGDSIATVRNKNIQSTLQKLQGENWYYERDSRVREDGSFGYTARNPGTYRIQFRPWDLAGSVNTYSESFEVTEGNKLSFSKSFGDIRLAAPNARFKVRTANGSSDLEYRSIQAYGAEKSNSGKSEWMTTGQRRIAEFNFDTIGNYDLVLNPSDDGSVGEMSISKRYRASVTHGSTPGTLDVSVDGIVKDSSGSFVLRYGSPNLTGRVVDSSGSGLPSNGGTSISLQKFESTKQSWQWTDQSTWSQSGKKFGFNLTSAGQYRLRIEPYFSNNPSYGLSFSQPFTVTADLLATLALDLGDVRLTPPTLKGTLNSPDGAASIANAQIMAINVTTGQQMWDYSRYTNQNGQWSVTLPEGKYTIYAKAPYGNSTYGNSEALENVLVDSSGVASISGKNSQALDIRLANPTWSGVVKLPGTSSTVMESATVCMQPNKTNSECVQTDSQGRWAFSKPLGFTGFDASSRVIVYPNNLLYAQNSIEGALAVTNALGTYVSGGTYSNIVLRPLSPNTVVTVTAGGNIVANAWVWAERPGSWLAGGVTDANGVARLNIPNPTQDFTLRVDIQGNQTLSATYSNAKKSYLSADITPVGGVFTTVVALPTPNFKGVIKSPAVAGGTAEAIATNSSINIYNESTNEWVSGRNTGSTGEFSAYLQRPTSGTYTYGVSVNPRYSADSLQSYRSYRVQVSSNGTTVVTDSVTNQNLTATSGIYTLFVRNASVAGEVTLSDGLTSVADSWIETMQTIQEGNKSWKKWVEGSNSKSNGSFGLALNDGNYELKANTSRSTPGQAPSAKCAIQVTNGAVSTADSDCVNSGKVKLKLREPNLSFTLANNGVALTYAHVSVSAGNWSTWASTDENGKISLFIDTAQIANENPSWSGTKDLNFWFYPQSNNSDVVRWNCRSGEAKPVCSSVPDFTIGQEFTSTIISLPIQAATPNTRITIKTPAGVIAPYSQVTLYKEMSGYRNYIDYSSADENGLAAFNIENYTSSDRFSIEVRAPWELRQTHATATYRNISFANLNNQEFALAAPNFKLNIKQALGVGVSKWGGISIQEVNAINFGFIDWVGSYGVDEAGFSAMKLDNSKTYKITAHPGYKAAGTTTECFVSVDGAGIVSTVSGKCAAISSITNGVADFTLSAGNVVGRIVRPNGTSPVEGAIVFAEAYNSVSGSVITGKTLEAVTNANGDWGLQLDTSYTWKLKVFYVNLPTDVPQLASVTTPIVVTQTQLTSASGSIDVPVTLSAK